MARKKGNNGALRGKVGNLVYTSWKGIEVVKTAPVRTEGFSEKQLQSQYIFRLTQDWLRPIMHFVKIGFKGYTQTNEGVTAAKSYLSHHALNKAGYESTIDPSRMLVSYGDLPLSEDIQVQLTAEKELQFSWNPTVTRAMAPLDQVMLLAYNVEEAAEVSSLGGHFRKAGAASISLANAKSGEYHVYLAFVAEDRSRQSNSVYLGTVSVEG